MYITEKSCRARARGYQTDEGPWDPISGAASALTGTATSMMMGVADMPIQTLKLLNIHPDARAASKKGKEKANSSGDASNTGESSRPGRPATSRTATGADSTMSGQSTPPTEKSGIPDIASPDGPGSPSHRSQFMAEAFSASAHGSRSPSRERSRILSPDSSGPKHKNSISSTDASARSNTGSSSNFADNLKNMQVDSAVDTGKGLARIVGAGFKSPMDFSLNVAKGFHNVPKLYGGEVRKVDNVTDFKSGISTAAKVRTASQAERNFSDRV